MTSWTIIKVNTGDGYFFDALEVDEPIDPALDLDLGDDYIKAGAYEIMLVGLDEAEVDKFFNLSAGEREAVYLLNKMRPE